MRGEKTIKCQWHGLDVSVLFVSIYPYIFPFGSYYKLFIYAYQHVPLYTMAFAAKCTEKQTKKNISFLLKEFYTTLTLNESSIYKHIGAKHEDVIIQRW